MPRATPNPEPPPTPASGVAQRTQTLLILLLTLLPRLAVLCGIAAKYPATPLFSRGLEMGLLARSLVQGHGLSSPFGFPAAQIPTGPTAFIAPGYPLLIAAVFRIFGTYSFTSELVIIALQIALNLLTIALILHLARTVFNSQVAILAGLLWACSPPLIFMPTIFWDTSLATALITGLLALALRIRRTPTPAAWLFLGAYCAVAALITPALLLVLLAVTLWLAWHTRPGSNALLAALAFAVVFAPWPLRNARVFHAFIPLRTTVGFELWMGNRPAATGYLDESLFPTFNPQELSDYNRFGEVAYTGIKSHLALRFIGEHPAAFLHLTALRTARFWLGTGTLAGSPFFPLHAVLTSTLGLLGLALLFRSRRRAPAVLLTLPLLLFPLPYYITHAEFRYRLLIDPLLTLLAAHALVQIHAALSTRVAASLPRAGHTHPHPQPSA